ncbi:MAG: phosphodiester glycosidase family protein [Vicinamibacterales bacterium]
MLLLVLASARPPATTSDDRPNLGSPKALASGVALYHLTDQALLDPPAPVSIWILLVDPASVDLRAVLANGEIMDTETVGDMAVRHGAVAAVNAGFFLRNGDPSGIYKIGGQLVSDTRRSRGAVGIIRGGPAPRLVFGRVSATMALHVRRRARPDASVPIAGVDTTRLLGRLMLFTPAYHAHTDTAPGGLEWVVDGDPLRVTGQPRSEGKTPIPKSGFVLSFGGRSPPEPLASLRPGSQVDLETQYTPADGPPDIWEQAHDIVGGAGLLARDGQFAENWTAESFGAGFVESRHPRTMIGTRPDGSVWLVTIDGRQPELSAGMTLVELRELARGLGLTNALNLDGGGSTTMWAGGTIVNSPSDAAGPRKVSDALLVMTR